MKEQTGRREIIPWVDLIRVVAIFLVVVGHVSGQLTNIWGQIPDRQWWIANVYGSFGRLSVPLFFMVSGYLLMPRRESLREFYTKRMPKILIPFLAWSLIYLLWRCGSQACTPGKVADLLLFEGTYYHLWFLYTLLGIYLVLPVVRLIVHPDTDRQLLWYLIGLWLVFQPGLTLAERFLGLRVNISVPLAGGFICYFVLGYLLGELAPTRLQIALAMVIGPVALLATMTGTYLLTHDSARFDGFFYELDSLNVILASAAAFVLIKKIAEGSHFGSLNVPATLRRLAIATFGIYLLHALVMEVLIQWTQLLQADFFTWNVLWSVPLLSVVVFLVSFLIVRLMQRLPFVKYIVP